MTINIQEEFDRLFKLYYKNVIYYLSACGADEETANDLAQETFVALFRDLLVANTSGYCKTWLLRTAHNKWIDFLRKNPHYRSLLPLNSDEITITAELSESDEYAFLDECLNSDEKKKYLLYHRDGYSIKEIADILGIKYSACRKQFERIQKKIKKYYTPCHNLNEKSVYIDGRQDNVQAVIQE